MSCKISDVWLSLVTGLRVGRAGGSPRAAGPAEPFDAKGCPCLSTAKTGNGEG